MRISAEDVGVADGVAELAGVGVAVRVGVTETV